MGMYILTFTGLKEKKTYKRTNKETRARTRTHTHTQTSLGLDSQLHEVQCNAINAACAHASEDDRCLLPLWALKDEL